MCATTKPPKEYMPSAWTAISFRYLSWKVFEFFQKQADMISSSLTSLKLAQEAARALRSCARTWCRLMASLSIETSRREETMTCLTHLLMVCGAISATLAMVLC